MNYFDFYLRRKCMEDYLSENFKLEKQLFCAGIGSMLGIFHNKKVKI